MPGPTDRIDFTDGNRGRGLAIGRAEARRHVLGSLLAWIEQGVPVVMCGDHKRAGQFAGRILFTCARRRYRDCSLFGHRQADVEANQLHEATA